MDIWGAQHLDDLPVLERVLEESVAMAGATLLSLQLHHFGSGQGVTGVAMLCESHVSIHTWPESGYAALDVFMCGDADPYLAVQHWRASLQPQRCVVRVLKR